MDLPADARESPARPRDLRPMGIGALLDHAIYFFRLHFLPLVAYTALFTIPVTVLTLLTSLPSGLLSMDPTLIEQQPGIFAATALVSGVGGTLLGLATTYIIYPLQAAGIAFALREYLLAGRTVTLRDMLRAVRAHYRPLLVTGFVALILSLLLSATFLIPPVGLAVSTLFAFAFYIGMFVVPYERREGLDALRRGWILARGSVWRVLGYFVVFFTFSMVFGLILGGLAGAAAVSVTIFLENPLLTTIASLFANAITGILTTPLVLAVAGLLYFDLRIRHEGLDVALATVQDTGGAVDLAMLPASEEPVINETTWRAIGILTAVYTGVIVLFCACIAAFVALIAGL